MYTWQYIDTDIQWSTKKPNNSIMYYDLTFVNIYKIGIVKALKRSA